MLHIFDWFASKAGAGFPMVGWPPTYDFFRNPPSKPMPPMVRTPHLKMSPAPHLKNTPPPPLKREATFHEMIPKKSTINNNLKSS